MKLKYGATIFPSLLFCSVFIQSAFVQKTLARDLVDATGVSVHLSDHPVRVVTLAPSLAELASDFIGIDLERIVGVTESTDYPPALKKVTSVGQYQRINVEKVLSLKPDLVLATEDGNSKDQVGHLRELKVPVVVLKTNHFSEIVSAMKLTAEALGEKDSAAKSIGHFEQGVSEIRARGEKRSPKKSVMIQLDDDPLVVVGGASFLNEAVEIVGAKNIYGDNSLGYPKPSKEDVVRKNPDMILVPTFGEKSEVFESRAQNWARFPELRAVKNNQVKVILGDPLLRPSMRLLEGLALLEKTIYAKP